VGSRPSGKMIGSTNRPDESKERFEAKLKKIAKAKGATGRS